VERHPAAKQRLYAFIAILAASAFTFFFGLGRLGFLGPDEPRYAEVAREMLVSGDYITPHDNWVRYFEKPPLVYWATAAAIKVFGPNEFAVRLQAALASIGQVAVTEALGEAMFDASDGGAVRFDQALS